MIVLDQDHIEQSHSMVFTASTADREFVDYPESGRRLARVKNSG